jgi:hypothetical protein
MTGQLQLRPESLPLCGPADTIELIGSTQGTGRHAERHEWIYVAVHRGHGVWTHIYDVVHLPGAFGDEIRLIRVMPGDRQDEARSWALAKRGSEFTGRGNELTGMTEDGGNVANAGSTVNTTKESRCLLPAEP